MELSLVRVIHEKLVLRVDKCPCREEYLSLASRTNNRIPSKAVNLDTLELLATSKKLKEITVEVLIQNGLIGKKDVVKNIK